MAQWRKQELPNHPCLHQSGYTLPQHDEQSRLPWPLIVTLHVLPGVATPKPDMHPLCRWTGVGP